MTEWGAGIYENDDALDWIYDLLDSGGLKHVKYALDVVAKDPSGPYEAADCRIALAAADLVAALNGDINPNLPEEAEDWIAYVNLSDAKLRSKAENVVRKIMTSSELKTVVEENGQIEEWSQVVMNLLKRLEL